MHSSPKFSLPQHLLTAGLFQEFLFCLYSTYLCALESTSLPCLLATLRWCRRDRKSAVFNTMTITDNESLMLIVIALRTEFSESLRHQPENQLVLLTSQRLFLFALNCHSHRLLTSPLGNAPVQSHLNF